MHTHTYIFQKICSFTSNDSIRVSNKHRNKQLHLYQATMTALFLKRRRTRAAAALLAYIRNC